ncbi:MAG: protease inhibitor I42 family protein [Deltaproteobacteria bacterium]|nr:protease inhibitor I42 family protein [Deltaproteobacteria bacterium]
MWDTISKGAHRFFYGFFLLTVLAAYGYAAPAGAGLAHAAGPPSVSLRWQYEVTDHEEVILDKLVTLDQVAAASRSSLEVAARTSGGKRLATVTLKGEGSVADLRKVIFNPAGDMKKLIMQPARLSIRGETPAGKDVVVKVVSNISTGYGWTIDAAPGMSFTKNQDEKFEQTSPFVGGAGTQLFFLRARQDGAKNIIMHYQRPWEESGEVSGALDIEVSGELPDTLDLSDPDTATAEAAGQSQSLPAPSAQQSDLSLAETLKSVPSSFDWRSSGGLTSIRDQGQCGSCWAFATVGVLEGAIKIRSGIDTDLSEQFLVSCNKDSWSCDGGWWAHDYHQDTLGNLQNLAGAVLETDMPYTQTDGTCRAIASHPYAINSWQQMSASPSVSQIKEAIYNYGPVSAAICSGPALQQYTGGIFSTDESSVCSGGVNHGIVLVGWNDTEQTWILRNSWGTGWGESGYMRIRWNTSQVGYGASYVNYQSSCSYSISPASATVPAAGSTGSVTVTTQSGCTRTAASNVSWITITSGASGTGGGTVSYTVAANTGSGRSGTLTIAGESFTVTQQAASSCTYTISPESATVSAAGSTGSVSVTTQSGCAWTSSSNLGWASITAGASGAGSGTVSYSIGANTGDSRSGAMTIAGRSFTISQAAPTSCTYSLNSLTNTFAADVGTGSISVNTGDSCTWTAASSVSWASITTGTGGTGSSTIVFSVAANTGSSSRSGAITVGDQEFSFTQQGVSSSDTPLNNGVALNQTMTPSISGGTWKYYYVTLPVGASDLSIEVTNMTADVDLYVNRGEKPLASAYDCNSMNSSTSNDSCSFSSPESGQWWIGVRNWATGLLSYRITATWSSGGGQSTLGDAVDAASFSWATGGNAVWTRQQTITHDGVDAAGSGEIADSQQSWMETSVTGPLVVSFWWQVSSESGYDYLRFAVDGTEVFSTSGEQDWEQKSYILAAGAHALRWSYTKDGSASSGSDIGWVDQISLSSVTPIVGDWDGDGYDNVGLFSGNKFLLDVNDDGIADAVVPFARSTDLPVTGDWDGDGYDDIGVFRSADRKFFLDDDLDSVADATVTIGRSSDLPVVGDWDSDGYDDIGVFRPSARRYYLDFNEDGIHNRAVTIGRLGDYSLVGDWDGDGVDSVGIFRPSAARFYLDDDDDGVHDHAQYFGLSTDVPVIGDWDGDGDDDIGVYRPSTNTFYLDEDFDGTAEWSVPGPMEE